MRVLVTGAGGFIGRHVAIALAQNGQDVVASYRQSLPIELTDHSGITLLKCDINADIPIPGEIDALIHCAAEIPAREPDEEKLFRVNVDGTRYLYEAAAQAGATSIVYCSSMAVYGSITVGEADERTPISSPDTYGRSKLEGERLLSDLIRGNPDIRGVSIRLPGIVGKGSHDNFLSNILPKIMAGEQISARNPDAPFNNVVHVAELATFIAQLPETMPPDHAITTIAANEPIALRDVLATLFKESSRRERVSWLPNSQSFVISNLLARKLGYAPVTVKESLMRFVHDYQKVKKTSD